MLRNTRGLTRTQAMIFIVGGFGGILVVLTGVMYYLTQLEKKRALGREVVKPALELTVALNEAANDMPFFFAKQQFFQQKEFLTVTVKETDAEDATVAAVESGEAQMGIVYVDRLLGHEKLRIIAPISYFYLCGNAGDRAIAAATDLKQLTAYKLVTNLPEGGFYDKYLRHQLAGQTIERIEIKDTNQIEWRAVIRQPSGEVFFGTQPYCSQYEKYNFETRKDDKGVVFSAREALGLQKAKPPARVLVATQEFITQNGEAVFRVRAGLKAASEATYKVPTKLESATFYHYQGRTSPQGYSLAFDWEMAYRVARVLVERDLYPKPDGLDTIDVDALKSVFAALGEQVDDRAVAAMMIDADLQKAIAGAHGTAEQTYTVKYLSEEELAEKLRLAEAESATGESTEWERDFEMTGAAQPVERIYNGAITDELYGVHFLNPQHGWIVGYYGTIVATTDGGKTFQPQRSGVVELLKAVYFVDENQGWITGAEGVILHTSDGGKTWVRQTSGTEEYLRDVVFTDAQHGLAVGRTSVLLRTGDGGATWTPGAIEAGRDDRVNRIRFAQGAAWAVGEFGALYVSRDQGETWQRKETGVKTTLTDVTFADAQHGLITGLAGLLLSTADGGESWQTVATGTKNNLFGLAMPSVTEAVACGDQLLLKLTATSGAWSAAAASIDGLDLQHQGAWLYTLSLVNGTVWGVGQRGTVVASTGNGAPWRVVQLKAAQAG